MVETAPRTALNGDIEEYVTLVRAFPLVYIRDDAHLADALATYEPIFDKGRRQSEAEKAYMAVLTDLIEAYEDATVNFPAVSGVDIVRHFMEDRGLRQKDLVGPVFATQSIVSEVLTGERALTLPHIKALAAFFHVAPAVFIDD